MNMLEEFFERYKRYIALFLSLSIGSFFYFFGDEQIEEKQILKDDFLEYTDAYVKPIIYETEVKKEEKIYENTSKIKIKEEVVKIETNDNKIEEKEIVLLSRNTEDNRYFIQLISTKELKNYDEKTDFFIITATINDGYDKSLFPMSLSKSYLEDTNTLILKIEDKKNKIKSICDGYFLDSLSKGFSYHIKIDFREEQSECYIIHQSDFFDENYTRKEKEYVEIKAGVMGQLLDKKIKFTDIKEFETEKIHNIVESL